MSAEEAEIAAYKRARTEKIIAGLAGATIASAAAIVAYKHYKNTVDSVIKPGTLLQNINRDGETGIKDAFYFSMNKSDNRRYRGLYGGQILNDGNSVHETQIAVRKALNVASPRNAQKALSEMAQNEHHRSMLFERLREWQLAFHKQGDPRAPLFDKAVVSLIDGRVDKNAYDAFNITLVGNHSTELNKKFFDLLKSKGYSAIMDMNDKKYSGYSTKNPMIAFDVGKKAAVSGIQKLDRMTVRSLEMSESHKLWTKECLKKIARLALPTAAISLTAPITAAAIRPIARDRIVADYRKEHPNTKLSYNEILDNYYSE